MSTGLVGVDPRARAAYPWLPAVTRAGRVLIGPLGETLRSRADGGMDPVQQGGAPFNKSIAADPTAPPRAA